MRTCVHLTRVQPGRGGGGSHERRAVEEGQAIKEDYDPNESRKDEEIRVPAQPQVVQGHLLPKVVPDRRERGRKVTRCDAQYGFLVYPVSPQVDSTVPRMGECDRIFIYCEQKVATFAPAWA